MLRTISYLVGALIAAIMVPTIVSAQAASRPSSADCRLRIDTVATNWVIDNFDPFSDGAAASAYDVLFVNEGDGDCRFYPRFDTDQATLGLRADAGPAVPYTLLDMTSHYDATPIAGRTVRRATNQPVVIASRGQQLVRYILNVPGEGIGGDGLFTQRLLLTAEDLSGSPLSQRQLVVGLRVAPSATLSLAGAFTRNGSQADIDLGDLSQGAPAIPLNLQVFSTRGYRLAVESLNGGRLRLGGTGWMIPYTLLIQGKAVRFGESGGYLSGNNSILHRDSLPLAFSIGSVADYRAGSYSDVLTISISPI
jgi:hypothetical protein